jgi:phosphatidylserine/phosphatidylglycerophosphate/cardiolipin synthase-like enzyme
MKSSDILKIVLLLIVIVIILNWATITDLAKNNKDKVAEKVTEITQEKTPSENSTAPEIYFCPRDDCNGGMTAWLDAANTSIHCAFFELELDDVREKLKEKGKAIDVKLITDTDYYNQSKDVGNVRQDNRSAFMHNKFCIIDGVVVLTGSFNPTPRCAFKNNNNLIVYQSAHLAANYEDEFQEMWNGKFGKGDEVKNPRVIVNGHLIENYFCPEDWCSNKVIYALQKANSSIYFMTFSFTHDEIRKQIVERYGKGVAVRGVIEKSQNNKDDEYDELKLVGIPVRWDGNSANMHHKVFIIDNETVVTGSFNPSKNGDTRNDENILIIHDPDVAAKYLSEFEKVWGEAGS